MARRVLRTWAGSLSGNLTLVANTPNGTTVVEDDGSAISQGKVWCNRVIGCVNIALSNVVIGSPNIHLWHGFVNMDHDLALSSQFPVPTSGDENAESWLWREPIPLWPTAFGQTGAIDDFILSYRYDIQFRGGKGSNVNPESRIAHLFHRVGDASPGMVVNYYDLALFTAS